MARSRDRKGEQSERTREALVAAARRLFAEKGFGATGTEEIVALAGVTRGALYHQYEDKRALFLDVFEHVERDLMQRLVREMEGVDDPIAMLRLSAEAFLDLCGDPEVRRIALIDAPSVLGWETWREVDARHALGLLRMLLQQVAARGRIEEQQVEPLSHLFLGAVSEAAMVVAHQPGHPRVRERMGRNLVWLIDRIVG